MATQVTFGKGTKNQSTDYTSGQIYFQTDEKKIYLDGQVYGDGKGDSSAYTPESTDLTTIQIGGISAGTKASDLATKNVSQVLDMLLYPDYAPRFVEASISLSKGSDTVDIGTSVSAYNDTTITYNKAHTAISGNSNYVSGGEATTPATWSGTGVEYNKTNTNYTVFPASYVYTASTTFAVGTEKNKSSKGTETRRTASNTTTLLADATDTSKTTDEGYLISQSKSASYTITVSAPIYGTKTDITNADEQLTTTTTNTIKDGTITLSLAAETANDKQTFKLPNAKLSAIKAYNTLSGKYEPTVTGVNGWDETTEVKTVNGVQLTYYVYKNNGVQLGGASYQITTVAP